MKIFLDTGDIEAIRRANDTGLLDGVTTNPSHIAKAGRPFCWCRKSPWLRRRLSDLPLACRGWLCCIPG